MELICENKELTVARLASENLSPTALLHFATAPRNAIAQTIDVYFKNVVFARENNVNKLMHKVEKQLKRMRKMADAYDKTSEARKPKKELAIRNCYASAMENIERISKRLLGTKIQLSTEAKLYSKYEESIVQEYKKLSEYVSMLEEAIKIVSGQVTALRTTAQATNDTSDIVKYSSREKMLVQMNRKLHDLKVSEVLALQTICQLNLMATNNAMLCEQIQTIMFEGMSVFKSSMIIAIGNRDAKAHIDMVTEGIKSIMSAQNKYEETRKNSKEIKKVNPADIPDVDREIVRLRDRAKIS